MIERDDTDELPEVRDLLGRAISHVVAHIFEALPVDCPERQAALSTIIGAHTRIAELLRRHKLN